MGQIDLEVLGLNQEELQERVVEHVCDRVLKDVSTDEDDEEYKSASPWREALDKLVTDRINAKVDEMAAREVVPAVGEIIENLVLQSTTAWGERRGEPVTFIEYLIQRAEAYLKEEVTGDGKKPDSYSQSKQKRISWMIDQHLHYSIEKAMKQALAEANSNIVAGLEETVKMKLAEIAAALHVTVQTK